MKIHLDSALHAYLLSVLTASDGKKKKKILLKGNPVGESPVEAGFPLPPLSVLRFSFDRKTLPVHHVPECQFEAT